jgi:cytochrome P450
LGYFPSSLGPKPYETMDALSKKYGPIFSIRITGRTYVVLSSWEVIRGAYVTDDGGNNFLDRPDDFNVLGSILDFRAMAFKNGEEWKAQRRVLQSSMLSRSRAVDGGLEGQILDAAQGLLSNLRNLNSQPTNIYR